MTEQNFFDILKVLPTIKFDEFNCTDFEFDEIEFDSIIMNFNEIYAYVTFKEDLPVERCIDLSNYSTESFSFNDLSKININNFVSDVKTVCEYLDKHETYFDEDGWRGRMCWEWSRK